MTKLYLDGILIAHEWHDLNGDHAIDQEEAAQMSDAELGEVLMMALDRDANIGWHGQVDEYSNHHHEFFNALPTERIVALFRQGYVEDHYLYSFEAAGLDKFIAGMELVLQGEAGYFLADQYFNGAELIPERALQVFEALEEEYPQYAKSRLDQAVEISKVETELDLNTGTVTSQVSTASQIISPQKIQELQAAMDALSGATPNAREVEGPPEIYSIKGIENIPDREEFNRKVLGEKISPVLVVWGDPACPACASAKPFVQTLQKKFSGGLKIVIMDVSQNEDLGSAHNLIGVPSFTLYQYGEVKQQVSGLDQEAIMKMLETYVPKVQQL